MAESVHRKNVTDATSSLVNSAMDMVEAKGKEMDSLGKDNIILRLYNSYLLTGVRALRQQLIALHVEPCFDPQILDEFKQGK